MTLHSMEQNAAGATAIRANGQLRRRATAALAATAPDHPHTYAVRSRVESMMFAGAVPDLADVQYLERVADPVTQDWIESRIEDLESLRRRIRRRAMAVRCDPTLYVADWLAIVCTDAERADLEGHCRCLFPSPAYALGNLSGRIGRLKAKLDALREHEWNASTARFLREQGDPRREGVSPCAS